MPNLRQRLYSPLHDRRSTTSIVVHEVSHSSATFGCQPSNRRCVPNNIQAPCALVLQACRYGYLCPRIPSLGAPNICFDRIENTRPHFSLRHVVIDRCCPRHGCPGSEHRSDHGTCGGQDVLGHRRSRLSSTTISAGMWSETTMLGFTVTSLEASPGSRGRTRLNPLVDGKLEERRQAEVLSTGRYMLCQARCLCRFDSVRNRHVTKRAWPRQPPGMRNWLDGHFRSEHKPARTCRSFEVQKTCYAPEARVLIK
jgi:hypothetical protein